MRKEFCEKDGIRITYMDENVCFEDMETAESILIANNEKILFNNFGKEKTEYFLAYFRKIYHAIEQLRELD